MTWAKATKFQHATVALIKEKKFMEMQSSQVFEKVSMNRPLIKKKEYAFPPNLRIKKFKQIDSSQGVQWTNFTNAKISNYFDLRYYVFS